MKGSHIHVLLRIYLRTQVVKSIANLKTESKESLQQENWFRVEPLSVPEHWALVPELLSHCALRPLKSLRPVPGDRVTIPYVHYSAARVPMCSANHSERAGHWAPRQPGTKISQSQQKYLVVRDQKIWWNTTDCPKWSYTRSILS